MKYNEYKSLNLPKLTEEVLFFWEQNKIFDKSITSREGKTPFVFYEGPPSANGLPGIHHVMARTIKDIFCRYQTLKGKQVKRKAGWDTHGLPIELAVEKKLGITKEDIGKKISIDEYNQACRKEVMKYTDIWNDLTRKMGYWVDMEHPYITFENNYIESVWYLLQKLYNKELIYKGYTIQPYSPAAGTGLSTHELNQPGCYRDVKDRTAVAMFRLSENALDLSGEIYFLAWTTTPWTLPSNTALAVGKSISYVAVKTMHPTSKVKQEVIVILAKDLMGKYFSEKNAGLAFEEYQVGDKNIPFEILKEFKGKDLEGLHYEQLLTFSQPTDGAAFKVVLGDFVTTEDGTGIVHIAPSFGSDDFRVAKQNGLGSLTLVDKRGKFLPEIQDGVFLYGDEYVKEAYLSEPEKEEEFQKQKKILEANGKIKELKAYLSVDERIVLKLQEEGKLFKKELYEHSYPHCWRTDKPVLYYPLDSWFIRTTAMKDRMIELNKTINWKPESTGTGRFGNWLENLQDWNLSRSRYWGIPLPIWRTEDASEELIIGSIAELKSEIAKAEIAFGEKTKFKLDDNMDLHRPYVDDIVLVSPKGKKMFRESDLIDVWFDSGAMPYAQLHYPFENKELIDDKKYFPADYIAEGVDQTRGWFFTLHAIASMCFDSVAFKNVISNGLVLDKNGNKMSKRLGNATDPFETLKKYGPDATRWYMITNAQPWDNLKFDVEGIAEAQRKFFGTLYNTYSFFALYANIDGFSYSEADLKPTQRPEIDRWILSELNTLIKVVDESYTEYEPTKAGRAIQYFVDEHLSNWYVRLCRRRFWKGEYTEDKISAYQTLYTCLETIACLMSPIAPFFSDKMYQDLNLVSKRHQAESVHLAEFPRFNAELIDKQLEERMELAQQISSMVLSIRKKENIRVRQPLNRIQIPVLNDDFKSKIEAVKELILSEVNVKELNFVTEAESQLVKNLKLNFKTLGKKFGKQMKAIQEFAQQNSPFIIAEIEQNGKVTLSINAEQIQLETEDVEIIPVDLPGWKVANEGAITVALDINISEQLKEEGMAREFINRIQNIRKDKGLDVTDKIDVKVQSNSKINSAISNNLAYICTEILASDFELVEELKNADAILVEIDESIQTSISLSKTN